MEYEIEEEDLLFDHATSNPSLLRPSRRPGGPRPALPLRKDLDGTDSHQMG